MQTHLISRRAHVAYVRRAVAVARAEHRPAVVLSTPIIVREPSSSRTAPRPHDATTAIEALILQRDADTSLWRYVASSEPGRDGRGTVDSAGRGVAVNGTETRVAPRWTASRRALITTVDPATGDAVPVDWSPYRVLADGTRVPLVSSTTARKRKRVAGNAKATRDARLRAIAGTLGADAQG